MARDITVTFDDGSTHVYKNAPDDVTPDAVSERAQKDFGKSVTHMDGGKKGKEVYQGEDSSPGATAFKKSAIESVVPSLGGLAGAEAGFGIGAGIGGLAGPAAPVVAPVLGLGGAIVGGLGGGYLAQKGQEYLGGLIPEDIKSRLGFGEAKRKAEKQKYPTQTLAAELGTGLLGGGLGVGSAGGSLYRSAATSGQRQASKMAREALGENLDAARQALQRATGDMSASEALAMADNLNVQTAQALLKRAEQRQPEFFANLVGKREAQNLKMLEGLAGGGDATKARQAREQIKDVYTRLLIPKLKTELEAVNLAGQKARQYGTEATRMRGAAADKVQDVRRFAGAKERAEQRAASAFPVEGQPRVPGRYTYMDELAKRAEDVMDQAANASLRFGDAARHNEYALQSLSAHGLQPLKGDQIIAALGGKLRDPSIAGNRDVEQALMGVAKDIKKWSDANGVIDAVALDAIRKNSVNAIAQRLYRGDPAAQKQFAGKVVEQVRPLLIDAMEQAGGTGYRAYLQSYADAMRLVEQKQMSAQLLHLYETSPQQFVRLVEGKSPDEVEKVFGYGNYDLAKNLSQSAMTQLQSISKGISAAGRAEQQAQAGLPALTQLLKTDLSMPRLPSMLNRKVTIANQLIDQLEGKVSKDTLNALNKAARSAKNFDELLSNVPPKSKNEILRALSRGTVGAVSATAAPFMNTNQ